MEPDDDALPPLRRHLARAANNAVDIATLAARWRMARVELRCAGGGGEVANPNTAAKLRGALGRRLAEGASASALAGGPCSWPAPCAYDLLFNAQGFAAGRLEIPKPFVLAVEEDKGDLIASMTLFGDAVDWVGEAADALVRALRGGIDVAGGRRLELEPVTRWIGVTEGVAAAPPSGARLRLAFVTPLILRQGDRSHADPESLIKSLANRVSGLALWHGVALAVDGPALAAEAAVLGAGAEWEAPIRAAWKRGSRAQRRRMDLRGMTGTLTLPPAPAFVASLVAIGEHTHAGGRTTLGMGRYTLLALAA